MNDTPLTREEVLQAEMDPNLNPLIPDSYAARRAQQQMEQEDSSHAADERRLVNPEFNPLVKR